MTSVKSNSIKKELSMEQRLKDLENKNMELSMELLNLKKTTKVRDIKSVYSMHLIKSTIKKAKIELIIIENKDDTVGFIIEVPTKILLDLCSKIDESDIGKTIDFTTYKLTNNLSMFHDNKWVITTE